MKPYHNELIKEFYEAILLLENQTECDKFFEDICTVKELQDISQRLSVAKMLKEGKSYQVISKETGASTATISRVNRCLLYGSGGYETILKRIKNEDEQ
ncbi:MAG: TrpR YerC/YecD [Ruminococcaceae bacterium]|nr:TrpR YerC/YecD [Oscillospiraceae bacterium]